MKKIFPAFFASLLIVFMLGCTKNDVQIPENTLAPIVQLTAKPTNKTTGWYEVKLAGQIKDTVGLKTIHIQCDAFKLNQTIKVSMDPKTTTYLLDRIIKAPLSVQNEANTIKVTVENIYGVITSVDILLSDIEAPSFQKPLTDFIVEIVGNKAELNLAFTAIDNKGLKSVVVKVPALNINDSTVVSGDNFNFSKLVALPLKKGSFPISITLEDATGLKTKQEALIRVSRVVPYSGEIDLYVTPAKSQQDLSRYISGMPGIITKKGNFLYEVKYYSPDAGHEIYFLGQKTFAGYRFGQDPLGAPGVLTSNETVSTPIVLPARGYYKITLDTKTETYKLEADTPPSTELWALPSTPLAMAGAYFDDFPGASRPKGAVECVQSSANPYLYKTRVRMHKTVSFTLTPKDVADDKWLSPFWRYDMSLDGKLIKGASGKNVSYNFPNATAVYWVIITFDLHLQTCTVENDGLAL